MSASLNKVMLIGNVGRDPEIKYLPNGDPVANFSIACSESWKDKNSGEKKEKTEWVNCVIFGKLAEIVNSYVKKGSSLYLEGKLQTRKWQDKATGADRYSTEVVCDVMKMLGGKPADGASHGAPAQQQRQAPAAQQKPADDFEDDIPF